MFYGLDLVRLRQEKFEVTLPSRRINAGAIPSGGGEVEHGGGFSAQPVRGGGLFPPERREYLQHHRLVHGCDGDGSDDRIGVISKRAEELRTVLRVVPPVRVSGVVELGGLAKGDVPRGFGRAPVVFGAFVVERIDTVE